MTGEARLWRSWNTMRSRYATATPALIPEYAHGCTRAAHVAKVGCEGDGDGQPDVRIDEQSEVRGADLDMLRAGRDTVDTCLPVHHPVVAALDAGERHPYRPLGVERFQRGRCECRFGRVERASRDGVHPDRR